MLKDNGIGIDWWELEKKESAVAKRKVAKENFMDELADFAKTIHLWVYILSHLNQNTSHSKDQYYILYKGSYQWYLQFRRIISPGFSEVPIPMYGHLAITTPKFFWSLFQEKNLMFKG